MRSLPLAADVARAVGRESVETFFDRNETLIYLVLAIALVISLLHLGAMFLTRWGNRRVSGKSLWFSAIVHLVVLTVGAKVYFDPPVRPKLAEEPIEEPVTITTAAPIEGSDGGGREGFDGAAPWTRVPQTQRDASRDPLTDELAEAAEMQPERAEFEPTPSAVAIPQTPLEAAPLDESVELAKADAMAEASPLAPAAAAPLDEPTLSSRQPQPAAQPQRDRTQLAAPQTATTRQPQRATQAARNRSRTRATFTPTLDLPSDPLATEETTEQPPLARAAPVPDARLDLGPAPASLPSEAIAPQSRPQTPPTNSRTRSPRGMSPAAPSQSQPSLASRPSRSRSRSRTRAAIPMAAPSAPTLPIEQPNIAAGGFDRRMPSASELPQPYRNRAIDERLETAQKYGGNASTEQAVENALRFLAASQSPDGRWDASRFGAGTAPEAETESSRPNTGAEADTGISGLCLLAFMGAGNTAKTGPYAEAVARGVDFLIANQRPDGYLGGLGRQQGTDLIAGAYCHAIATFAMAEAVAIDGDQADARVRQALERALRYTYAAQLDDGGWRYIPNQDKGGDMSIFGWHLMGLKSAAYAGVDVPRSVMADAIAFLQNRSAGPNRGLAGYRQGSKPEPSMTAEALFCRQMLGVPRDHPSSREAVDYVLLAKPTLEYRNFYYWYYGTLAMYQDGGDAWTQWNARVQQILVGEQQPDGRWSAAGSEWGAYGGDLYATAIGALCLEVYYRYLPIYRQGEAK